MYAVCCIVPVQKGAGASIFATRKVVHLHNLIEPRTQKNTQTRKVRHGVRLSTIRLCGVCRLRAVVDVIVGIGARLSSLSVYLRDKIAFSSVPTRFYGHSANHVVVFGKCLAPQSRTPANHPAKTRRRQCDANATPTHRL